MLFSSNRAILFLGLLSCLALPTRSFAEGKYFYLMGGGGDPAGSNTMFDSELGSLGKFASHSDWDTTLSFDGGHSNTEKIAAEKFAHADDIGPFDQQHFNQMIEDLKARISSGKIAPGDELLLVIDSHGAMKVDPEQLTHDVATGGNASDLVHLAGTSTVSLDALQDVVQLANQNGVKLAIIDESCFSGNTQALANDKTCVISATGSQQFSYGPAGGWFSGDTFSSKFNRSMRKGKNLEDLFVHSRTADDSPDFPMISTPVGEELRNKLYALVSPYLDYDGAGYDLFSGHYSPGNLADDSCKMAQNFSELNQLLETLSSTVAQAGDDDEMEDLKRALQKYRDYQIRFENAAKGTELAGQEFQTLLASDYPDQKDLFAAEDGVTSLLADYASSISFYQGMCDKMPAGETKGIYKEALEQLKLEQKIVTDLRAKLSPAAQQSLKAYNDALDDASRKTRSLASNVSGQLKRVYDTLYRAESKTTASSNACRDFVL